jgi:hypothetical protein
MSYSRSILNPNSYLKSSYNPYLEFRSYRIYISRAAFNVNSEVQIEKEKIQALVA